MANDKTLFEVIENRKAVYLEDGDDEKFRLPEFVERNLKYPFFEWQKSARYPSHLEHNPPLGYLRNGR